MLLKYIVHNEDSLPIIKVYEGGGRIFVYECKGNEELPIKEFATQVDFWDWFCALDAVSSETVTAASFFMDVPVN